MFLLAIGFGLFRLLVIELQENGKDYIVRVANFVLCQFKDDGSS